MTRNSGVLAMIVALAACAEPFESAQPETAAAPPSRPLAAPSAGPWILSIPTPAGFKTNVATGVTGEGLVVGNASSSSAATGWATTIDPVSRKARMPMALAPLPKDVTSGATGVSKYLIAGWSTNAAGKSHAVYWDYPDPSPRPIPIAGSAVSAATAAGGGVLVGWFIDEYGQERAFTYEAGAAAAQEIPLPYPGRAFGASEDGASWTGCFVTPAHESVAFVRGGATVDVNPPPVPGGTSTPARGCGLDVTNAGAAVGYYWHEQSLPLVAYFNVAAVSSGPWWTPLFAPPTTSRPAWPFSEARGTGLATVGWIEVTEPLAGEWGVPVGRYGFYRVGSSPVLLPAIASPTEANGVSSDQNCLIAGRSGRVAVVWGC